MTGAMLSLSRCLCAAMLLAVAAADARGAPLNEQDIKLTTGTGVLAGTLASPERPAAPAVLMLPGSGPTDRNTNAPQLGLRSDAFKMLAEGLASKSITSLRIDKRGVGESAGAMTRESDLRFQTYGDDARAWAAELKRRAEAECVWLLGHSEGALVAEVAAQSNADMCGLILIAGAGRSAGAILREQLSHMPGMTETLRTSAFNVLSELEHGHLVPAVHPQLMALFRPSVQPYLISWLPLDPAALLKDTKMPVLIVQGDNDLQITLEDAKLLASARPDAKLTVIAGMNHVLKVAPTDRAGNAATYANLSLPLAPTLVDTIADFIHH